MPAGRPSQSGTMLYAVITFVVLFLIAATAAVVFYIQSEENKDIALKADLELKDIVSSSELKKIGSIVGSKQGRDSRLGTLNNYFNDTVQYILGGPIEDTSVEVKRESVQIAITNLVGGLGEKGLADIVSEDPNEFSLIKTMEELLKSYGDATETAIYLEEQLNRLQDDFDVFRNETSLKEDAFIAELSKSQDRADALQGNYDELRNQMEMSTDEQIKAMLAKLELAQASEEQAKKELTQTKTDLLSVRNKMLAMQKELEGTIPSPSADSAASVYDGQVVSVDNRSNTVVINMGLKDKIYRGLTFGVYDQSAPIFGEGKGKAEIEVLDVQENISVARIVTFKKGNPVMPGDDVANLIWDSNKKNVFVVAGKFDFNNDGYADKDGVARVKQLINAWGGEIQEQITVGTDFLVIGMEPEAPSKPTLEQIAIDPTSTERYGQELQKIVDYNQYSRMLNCFQFRCSTLTAF